MMPEVSSLDYAAASVQLRAPRVAIVMPSLTAWPVIAAAVLEKCTSIWGGAGFILVPHLDGIVTPLGRRIASAYDPDHLVTVELPMADLAVWSPADFRLFRGTEELTADQMREIDATATRPLSTSDLTALDALTLSCSPFLDDFGTDFDGEPRTRLTQTHLDVGRGLTSVQRQGADASAIDFSSETTSLASLWLRSVGGVVWPLNAASLPPVHTAIDGLRSLIGSYALADGEQIDWFASTGWAPSLAGLVPLLSWESRDKSWIVVGSTFEDFVLAHALSRLAHHCVWIPQEWLASSSPWSSMAELLISREHSRTYRGAVRVTSASISETEAAALCESAWRRGLFVEDESWMEPVDVTQAPLAGERVFLALRDDYAKPLALPVRRNDAGDLTLVTPLPPLLPDTTEAVGSARWVTDVRFDDVSMPHGRGYPGNALQAADNVWSEHVRSSRDGISYMGGSNGFVAAGSNALQSAARPRLVVPTLQTWLATTALASGHHISTSQAGHVASIASTLWPSRRALADDLADHRPIFATFLSETTLHGDRYPDHDGYLLGKDGYPTFAALATAGATCRLDTQLTRGLVDRLVVGRALRRGLILRCPRCSKEQFTTSTGPDYGSTCARCGRDIPLTKDSWSDMHDEPQWYYDLDSTVRQLLTDGGDVSLLAERWLARSTRGLVGIPEFEVKWQGQSKPSEIDLYCGVGDVGVVGECKVSPEIPTRERAKKISGLVRMAELVGATEVVLASGDAGAWSTSMVDRLISELGKAEWSVGRAPKLRLLSGLRTENVVDNIAGE